MRVTVAAMVEVTATLGESVICFTFKYYQP